MRLKLSFLIIITTMACVHRGSTPTKFGGASEPVSLTNASESELQQHVGKKVMIQGQFSLRGKVAPFILASGRPIYLVSNGAFSWGPRYEGLEGNNVQVVGTLLFAHYEHNSQEASSVPIPPDHYYFEAGTTKVELAK